jgi:hypothetical protein
MKIIRRKSRVSNVDVKFPEEVATDDPSVPIDVKLVNKFHIEKPLPKAQ